MRRSRVVRHRSGDPVYCRALRRRRPTRPRVGDCPSNEAKGVWWKRQCVAVRGVRGPPLPSPGLARARKPLRALAGRASRRVDPRRLAAVGTAHGTTLRAALSPYSASRCSAPIRCRRWRPERSRCPLEVAAICPQGRTRSPLFHPDDESAFHEQTGVARRPARRAAPPTRRSAHNRIHLA